MGSLKLQSLKIVNSSIQTQNSANFLHISYITIARTVLNNYIDPPIFDPFTKLVSPKEKTTYKKFYQAAVEAGGQLS